MCNTISVKLTVYCTLLLYNSMQESCDVDCLSVALQTPLHIATREGHATCFECLVGYGADVNAADTLGNAPIHYVLAKKNIQTLNGALHLSEVMLILHM